MTQVEGLSRSPWR